MLFVIFPLSKKEEKEMKNPSIIKQVQLKLDTKICYGQSKYEAKRNGTHTQGIYSHSTYDNYLQVGCDFAKWCRSQHGSKTLEEARVHAAEYLKMRIDKDLSAWTIKKDAAGLAKLYDCTSRDFGVELPTRHREDIIRSRDPEAQKDKFSEDKNKDLVEFFQTTGLRRHEAAALEPKDVYKVGETVYVHVAQGKGGKERTVEALNEKALEMAKIASANGSAKVFQSLPAHADIHAYRSEYAVSLYERLARDPETLEHNQVYYCRHDLAGTKYDKEAMQTISENLGHNRISVIAQSYLR